MRDLRLCWHTWHTTVAQLLSRRCVVFHLGRRLVPLPLCACPAGSFCGLSWDSGARRLVRCGSRVDVTDVGVCGIHNLASSPTCEERCYSSVVLRCVRSLCGRLTMSVSTWLVLGRWTYSTYLHRQRGLVAWHVGTSPGHISGEVQSTCCQCSGSHTLIAYISYLVRSSPFMPYPGVSGIDKDAFMLFICRGVVNPLIGGLHRWHLARHGSVGGLQPWSLTATSAGYRLECCLHTTG